MPYQYVREPLTAEESDRLSKACETPTDSLSLRGLFARIDSFVRLVGFSPQSR
jgi:hypothetical protein